MLERNSRHHASFRPPIVDPARVRFNVVDHDAQLAPSLAPHARNARVAPPNTRAAVAPSLGKLVTSAFAPIALAPRRAPRTARARTRAVDIVRARALASQSSRAPRRVTDSSRERAIETILSILLLAPTSATSPSNADPSSRRASDVDDDRFRRDVPPPAARALGGSRKAPRTRRALRSARIRRPRAPKPRPRRRARTARRASTHLANRSRDESRSRVEPVVRLAPCLSPARCRFEASSVVAP